MLKLEHITLIEKQRHLLKDVSFTFSRNEIISICAERDCEKQLAFLLTGILQPHTGTLQYAQTKMTTFTSLDLSTYRNTYVTSLFDDFQILPSRSVKDTLTFPLKRKGNHLQNLVKKWKLEGYIQRRMEDLTFLQQMRVLLARAELKQTKLLLVYPDSTPFSQSERFQLYELLKQSAKHCTVIILGDAQAERFAQRTIVIQDGYILADNTPEENLIQEEFVQPIELSITHLQNLLKLKNHHYRWAYRALKAALMTALFFISLALFSDRLDIVDVQMKLLNNSNMTAFTIDKLAQGDDETIYSNQYALMSEKDVELLKEDVEGSIISGYSAIDPYFANAYLTGIYNEYDIPKANQAVVYEANTKEDLGFPEIIGRYPESMDEVAISAQTARSLLQVQPIEINQSLLGKTIYWYGIPLKVSGIFYGNNGNIYVDSIAHSVLTNISNDKLYVKEGFLKQHPIQELKSFPLSYKRILADNRVMTLNDIYGSDMQAYYTDGDAIYELHDVKENEAILDLQTVINFGFPYQEYLANSSLTIEEKMKAYQSYAKQLTGMELNVQAYTISSSPSNSTIFQKKVKVKGILSPTYAMFEKNHATDRGNIYLSQSLVSKYEVVNIGIQSVYYQSKDPKQLKSTLEYLHKSKQYEAQLPQSNLFQFSIVDMKNLTSFYWGCAILLTAVCLYIFVLLQHKTKKELCSDMTLYYAFGLQEKEIKQQYRKSAGTMLTKTLLFSSIISIIFLSIYAVVMIYKLFSDMSLLWYLVIPIVLSILLYGIFQLSLWLYFKWQHVIADCYIHNS